MTYLSLLCRVLAFIFASLGIACGYRHEVVRMNRHIISLSIEMYMKVCLEKDIIPKVWFDDMESYDSTFWRFRDSTYENIVSKDKFNIIKYYIPIAIDLIKTEGHA